MTDKLSLHTSKVILYDAYDSMNMWVCVSCVDASLGHSSGFVCLLWTLLRQILHFSLHLVTFFLSNEVSFGTFRGSNLSFDIEEKIRNEQ